MALIILLISVCFSQIQNICMAYFRFLCSSPRACVISDFCFIPKLIILLTGSLTIFWPGFTLILFAYLSLFLKATSTSGAAAAGTVIQPKADQQAIQLWVFYGARVAATALTTSNKNLAHLGLGHEVTRKQSNPERWPAGAGQPANTVIRTTIITVVSRYGKCWMMDGDRWGLNYGFHFFARLIILFSFKTINMIRSFKRRASGQKDNCKICCLSLIILMMKNCWFIYP